MLSFADAMAISPGKAKKKPFVSCVSDEVYGLRLLFSSFLARFEIDSHAVN
jgi:hypothetical protein